MLQDGANMEDIKTRADVRSVGFDLKSCIRLSRASAFTNKITHKFQG
jgi:hypothetical protein